ncbi:MAG TPA: MopE-related protein, partial [Candidatus Polarisedimenticolaceae bacterium]|nr:MopE-related protein [Candidatus Polarisedimenticolaceae bacterium]
MSTPFLRASRPFLVVAALLPLVASHPVPPTLAVEHATGRRPAIEPNRGQFGPDVAFALRAAGGRVSFAAGRVELPGEAALGFGFLGGADPGTLEPVEPSPGLVHYVAGSDPEGWVTGVPTFGGLLRRGVYPGVDVLFRGGPAGLELELVLAPWADPSAVVLDFGRAGAFRLDGEGAAILESGAEAVRIGQPALGTLLPAGGTVALHLNRGSGDASAPVHVHLSIDILVPPGRGLADLPRLATGAGGDVFVAGSLGGVELDARSARRGEHRGHPHRGARELQPGDAPLAERTGAFVSRVSGETVLETAWFGESMERPEAIATTPEGDVVLVGERGEDAFVLRLSRSGLRPIAEAAIGGAGEDVAQALAVDDGGEIWVAGRTASADLPVTDDALQAHPGGRTDGWVAHLDAALSVTSLTYLGGRGDDEATALAFDGNGTLHIAGTTTSADFPVRSPLQAFGGGRDAFLATLDPATGALRQATCYGADGDETPLGLAVHRGGDVLLLGKDAQPFLVRVAGDGSAVLQTVRLELPAAALALDPAGRIWIAGTLEGEEDGLTDAFVARLVPETFAPEETHLLAGDREDRAGALLLDARGRALLAGLTRSDELPGTTRTESTASGDVFLARIVPDTEAPQGTCPGDTHWVGPASGEDWATAANWSAGVPTATTDACIQNAAVIVSTAGQTAKSLRVEGGGAALTISGAGSLTLANASEIDAPFTLSSGTLTGDGSLTLSGLFTWGGGTMGGTGTTTANGGIAFTTAAEKTLTRTLIHSVGQNAVLSGTGPLMINSPGVLSNLGIFEHQTDASVTGSGTFDNAGSFLRTTSVGTAQISLGFTNSGTLEALSGDLHFTGPSLVQTAGSTTVNGGTITNAAPLLIQGGTLRGTGTITGSVSNTGGAVSPGLSPGTLNLVGGYTQGPGGDLTLELGGLTAGTEHDWLTLTNPGFGSVDAALDGSLTVSLVNGFAPAIGDSFTVLTGDTRTGTFATTNLPAFGCGKTWNVQYNATTVVLEVVAQPGSSDLVITPFVAPDPVAAGDPVTYSPKVGNSGPDDATQVTLTTTLPAGATFVSASSGCSEAGGIVTCAMGTIPAGSGSSAEIVVTFAAPGGPSFSSSVTSAECDPNPTDNTDRTISLIVLPACPDDDGDGYAVCSTGVACLPTGGDQCGDCDDSNGDVHPGAAEQCNGVDDDCTNGVPADEADDDTDGFRVCDGDCDDLDGNVHPGATEQCNGIDDDCADGIPADEGDGDGDGSRVCAGDCNDANPNVHPGVLEQCNGEDDDCDGNVPATEANGDDDGFRICDGDCDDGNPGVRPDAPETCDGLDTNCDGS